VVLRPRLTAVSHEPVTTMPAWRLSRRSVLRKSSPMSCTPPWKKGSLVRWTICVSWIGVSCRQDAKTRRVRHASFSCRRASQTFVRVTGMLE
jgi:hypothetical protein